MLAICEHCQCEDDHDVISTRVVDGETWTLLQCINCKEQWEEFIGSEGDAEIDEDEDED